MLIHRIDGGWYADASFAEKDPLKAARWRWHPGPEPGKKRAAPAGVPDKRWWTDDPLRAAKLIAFAEGEVRAELERIMAEHEASLTASRATDSDVEIPVPEGLAYLPFQRAGIAYAAQRPGVMVCDEMGLGKTVQAIGVVNIDPSINRVVVVCPASLRLNWQREIEKWSVRPTQVTVAPSKPSVTTFDACFTTDGIRVLVINYDVLHNWEAVLRSQTLDLLVVDEAHYLKSSRTRRSCHVFGGTPEKSDRKIAPIPARRKILLTGTPLVNRPAELFPLIHALDPKTWPSFIPFSARYCDGHREYLGRNDIKGHWVATGATNLDELQERLRSTIMVRRLKAEVLTELPPKTRQVIELPEDDAAGAVAEEQAWWQRSRAHIEQLAVAVELAKAADDPTAYQAALDAMGEATTVAFTEMARVRRETARQKVPYVIEHVRQLLEATDKVIVFGHHKEVIGAIAGDFGAEAVTITGDTALEDRQAAVDRFQTDPTCRVFVGGIMAAGVGLTLTAASTVVFAELDWVPGNVTQAEDRCILAGTPVLTEAGWRPIEQIVVGDRVVCADGTAAKVTDAWSQLCTKMLVEVSVRGWPEPLTSTVDHRWLTPTGWVDAEHLRPGDRIAAPLLVEAPSVPSVPFDDDCRLPSVFEGVGGIQRNGRLRPAPAAVLLNAETLFVLGYYAGDGFAAIGTDKGRFVSFSGNTDKKAPAMSRVASWWAAQDHEVSTRLADEGTGCEARIYSGEWALWFRKHFGHTAAQKRLPTFLLQLAAEQSRALLDGLLASDGYCRGNRLEYITASQTLAGQVFLLMSRCGYRPCLTVGSKGQFIVSCTPGAEAFYTVSRVSFRQTRKVNDRRESVYDLTVDHPSSSFVIGGCVVHNCHRIGQRTNVLVQHLVLAGSIDAALAKAIVDKQQIADAVLDTERDGAMLTAPVAPLPPREQASTRTTKQREIAALAVHLSPDVCALIHSLVCRLAGMCDGARVEDGHGFNKIDTSLGHALAELPFLTPKQAVLASRMVIFYRRQLPAEAVATVQAAIAAAKAAAKQQEAA